MKRNCGTGSKFLDVGAATGLLSLLGQKLGAQVLAIEPVAEAYKLLRRNVGINSLEYDQIICKNIAVSDFDGFLVASALTDSEVLNPIVFTGLDKSDDRIEVQNISHVARDFFRDHDGKRVMKIDIEGAEYKIFKNKAIVDDLATVLSVAFISFHPGFNVPHSRRFRKLLVLIDHYKVFQKLIARGSLRTISGLSTTRSLQFINRIRGGCLDWVWEPIGR